MNAQWLREKLDYNPETGVFLWRKPGLRSHVMAGDAAGHIDGRGYCRISLASRNYPAHRLAWLYVYGEWPIGLIDHINHNPSDNRISNLRQARHAENMQNRRRHDNNKSGLKGVDLFLGKYWRASIQSDGKRKHLGYFKTKEEAHEAYCAASAALHGAFGCAA